MQIGIDPNEHKQIVNRYNWRLLVYYGSYPCQNDYHSERSDYDIAFLAHTPQLFDGKV